MTASEECRLLGRWRIFEADLWDRAYLDMLDPAAFTVGAGNRGEILFGAMQAGLDLSYSRDMVFFRWHGDDDGHEASGEGSAELLDDGTVEITFTHDGGGEAVLKARRDAAAR